MCGNCFSRRFVLFCCQTAERMHAAVDIGIRGAVEFRDALDHFHGLLRGGGVIEVNQVCAVDLPLEDRELFPDIGDRYHNNKPLSNRDVILSRRLSTVMREMTSPAKEPSSSLRALSLPMPRAFR